MIKSWLLYRLNDTKHIKLYACLIVLLLLFVSIQETKGQCAVGPDDCITSPQEVLNLYTTVRTVGTDIETNENNVSISSGQIMHIPNGISFTGSITGVNSNGAVCIDEGGVFNGSYNNFDGTLFYFNTSATINLTSDFKGSIENYGGTINVTSSYNIETGKHLLNCSGNINWTQSLSMNSGSAIYNSGFLSVGGQLSGQGCIHNEAWLTINSYYGTNDILNNGKIEILSTAMSFNGGTVINNCAMFSSANGAQFQNNTSINNNGLIYLPIGNFENKSGYTLTNGETGVIRSRDLTNEGLFTGSGKVYITGNSRNINQGVFGLGSDNINLYDATPGGATGYFDDVHNPSNIGTYVIFAAFPEPEYSPDLSEYQCGDIILAGSVVPGEIAASQILCLGIDPEPFTSIEDASVPDNGAIITYQWQSSTDNVNFYNISGATSNTYTVTARPDNETHYRRRARATYQGADSIKNAQNSSNVLSLTPVNDPAPEFTSHPSNAEACSGQATQFTATAINHDSYRWQLSTDDGNQWNNLSEATPYSGVSSGTLNISEVSTGMNDYRYRLAAIHNQCGIVYSHPATLSVKPDDTPVVNQQPANQFICPNGTQAVFTVDASSPTEISYQWQVNPGSGWGDIANGSDYSGVNTSALTASNNGLVNEAQFRCVLQAECDNTTTNAATLYMPVPQVVVSSSPEIKCPDIDPFLDFNAENSQYNMGKSIVTFVVSRESTGPYSWQFDYEVTATPELLSATQPQAISGNITLNESTDEFELSFLLDNQTEDIVNVTFNITNVLVANCPEAATLNHEVSMQVRRMPVVGVIGGF